MTEEKSRWYDKNYKWLLAPPILILIIAIIFLANFNAQNGDIILKDVSLTGGTTITVFDQNTNTEDLKTSLESEFPDLTTRKISNIRSGTQQGFFVETSADVETIQTALENYLGYKLNQENSSIEFSGATLSEGFYKQLRFAIFLAFIFMAIVVFLIFRSPIPSLAVILAALADIVLTIFIIDLFSISLSSAGIVALLMLIGYSVDTDILLTTRVLRNKEGTINERLFGAFKTGLTMTLTSMIAISVALIIIYNFSETLRQIFTILLIGLGFDLFNTWFANATILKWYAEAKKL